MKYLLLVLLLPVVASAQSRKQRKAQEKADKELVANLKLHVQHLQQTKDDNEVAVYIGTQFKNAGLVPDSSGNYIQHFTVNEGKFVNNSTNIFTVNDEPLMINQDYFPLAFSGNASAEGSASISLREKGSPWFLDVKDMLDDNKNHHDFNINTEIKKQAIQVEERKASALIVYNSSATHDNIHFNKTDSTAAVHVPVIYISDGARKKYFKDATDFYYVKLITELNSRQTSTQNIVGYINNNASSTVIVHAFYKHYATYESNSDSSLNNAPDIVATASLIELARIIKKGNLHNNYLFIASPMRDSSFTGFGYWLENNENYFSAGYIFNLYETLQTPDAKTYTIGGANSSPTWNDIIKAADKTNQLVFDTTLKSDVELLLQEENIPALTVAINAPEQATAINYDAEKDAINFLARLIINADAKGNIPFTAAPAQP